MARLSAYKLNALNSAFNEKAMSPGQAAQAVGVTYRTTKRDEWADEIKRSLEKSLLPEFEASVKFGKKPTAKPKRRPAR